MNFRPLHLWIYIGLLGLVTFYLMRPTIDYDAAHTGGLDPRQVIERTSVLGGQLGFGLDSLVVQTVYTQNTAFYGRLKTALGIPDNNSVHGLHQAGYPLSSWFVSLSELNDSSSVAEASSESVRRFAMRYDQSGRVLNLRVLQPRRTTITVARDSADSGLASLLGSFGYEAEKYQLTEDDPSGGPSGGPPEREFTFLRRETVTNEPSKIVLRFLLGPRPPPVGERLQGEAGTPAAMSGTWTFETGQPPLVLESMSVFYSDVPVMPVVTETFNDNGVYVYSIALLIIGFIVITMVRRVFRNQVDWSRGSWVFFVFAGLFVAWTVLHMFGFTVGNIPPNLFWLSMVSTLVNSLLAGFFIAVGYLTWESMARIQGQPHLDVIDALWRGRLFIRETGESILTGYAFAGVLLGGLTLLLYGADALLIQTISPGNLNEMTSAAPAVSSMISAICSAALLSFGPLGVVYNYLHRKTGGGMVCNSITALVVALSMTSLSRLLQTDLGLWMELVLFFGLSLMIVFVLSRFGMLATVTAVTLFVLSLLVLPMVGSPHTFYQGSLWVVSVISGIPLVFGLISMQFGQPVAREERYIPEYQEISIKQQRFEREIEIARESQFSLMPVNIPVLPAHDVKGFFIPSLEVGGDYYDYHVRHDAAGNPEKLFMTVVDVSGKAMKAAMHAVFTSGLILSRVETDSPEEILSSINSILKEKTDARTFITCVIGEVDLHANLMRLSNAGHCKPILKRDGEAVFLETPAPRFPLGMRLGVTYSGVNVQLQSGDVLLFYSDGLPEAKNEKNQEYGFERVRTYIENLGTEHMSSTEICLAIKKHIQQYSNYTMRDDTTVICLKVR